MTYRRNKSVEERKRGWQDAIKAVVISLGTLLVIVGMIIAMRWIGIR